jgi:hypothetical protein
MPIFLYKPVFVISLNSFKDSSHYLVNTKMTFFFLIVHLCILEVLELHYLLCNCESYSVKT